MAGGEQGFGHKSDNKYLEAEADTDMPILCEICLGDNPMVRMMKNSANGSYPWRRLLSPSSHFR
jgi:hypothetical protein